MVLSRYTGSCVPGSRYSEVFHGFRLHRSESELSQALVSGLFSDGPAEDGFMACIRLRSCFGFLSLAGDS